MKILEANAGHFTNFEVLDLLHRRGACAAPVKRFINNVTEKEAKVYEYLTKSACANQTKEMIMNFLQKSEFDLAKAKKLVVLNIRLFSVPLINPIIESWIFRMGKLQEESEGRTGELLVMVKKVLPAAPVKGGGMKDEKMREAGVGVSSEMDAFEGMNIDKVGVEGMDATVEVPLLSE